MPPCETQFWLFCKYLLHCLTGEILKYTIKRYIFSYCFYSLDVLTMFKDNNNSF